MRVRVVSQPGQDAGFALAGLEVVRVRDDTGAAEAIAGCAADPEIAIVLVAEDLYHVIPRELVSRLDRQALPILVPVPAPRWDERSEAEDYVLEILRQAIGYRVRPR